jgi:triphosphoribosyl-dephospho-CoA synthetase
LISETALTVSEMNESLISAALMNESAQLEELNEGIGSTIKEAIKNFFAKIKKFIAAIIDKVKLSVTAQRKTGQQLVSTYGERVKKAKTEGIEIKGFKYLAPSVIAGWVQKPEAVSSDITSVVSEVTQDVDKYLAEASKETDTNKLSSALSTATAKYNKEVLDKLKEDNSEFKTKLVETAVSLTGLSSIRGKTITEIQQDIMKAGRGGATEKAIVKAKDYSMDTLVSEIGAGFDDRDIKRSLDAYRTSVDKAEEAFMRAIEDMEKEKSDAGAAGNDLKIKDARKSLIIQSLQAAKASLGFVYNLYNAINASVISLLQEDMDQKKAIFLAVARKTKPQNNSVEELDELDFAEFDL